MEVVAALTCSSIPGTTSYGMPLATARVPTYGGIRAVLLWLTAQCLRTRHIGTAVKCFLGRLAAVKPGLIDGVNLGNCTESRHISAGVHHHAAIAACNGH